MNRRDWFLIDAIIGADCYIFDIDTDIDTENKYISIFSFDKCDENNLTQETIEYIKDKLLKYFPLVKIEIRNDEYYGDFMYCKVYE